MIKHALSRSTGPRLEIMQTAARYEIDGAPRLDLVDARGQLHEAAEVLTAGSTAAHLSAIPEEGADVLTLTCTLPEQLGTFYGTRTKRCASDGRRGCTGTKCFSSRIW